MSVRLFPVLFVLLAVLLMVPALAAAHANLVRSEPAAGAATPVAPVEVRIWFSEATEARYSEIRVYDASGQRYDTDDTHQAPSDPLALIASLRGLPEGMYTVAWRANSAVDGHTTSGSFTFGVGNSPPPSQPIAARGTTEFSRPTTAEVVARWAAFLSVTAFTGALSLWLLVWAPVLRRAVRVMEATSDARASTRDACAQGQGHRSSRVSESAVGETLAARVGQRSIVLVGASLLVLFLATVAELLLQVAKVTGASAGDALSPTVVGTFLFSTRAGGIWSARLLLPLVAATALGPRFAWALGRAQQRSGTRDAALNDPSAVKRLAPPLVGVALGAGYLLTISLTSHSAASPFWTSFTIAMDWFHLLATAIWVGGLAGVALTAPLLGRLRTSVRPVLLDLVSRFSNAALVSVGVLTVTGLYSAWLHVGSFAALLPTAYGRTLVVKLAFAAGLVALGAFNLLWVRPRLTASVLANRDTRARPDTKMLRHFSRAIRLELALGVAVLLTVALLIGLVPAREALVQARDPRRAQPANAGDLRLTLALASLQPGANTFDVVIRDTHGNPVSDAQRVTLRIAMLDMDMGEAEVVAEPRGAGHYLASGPYLAMSGRWQVRVIVRRAGLEDVEATFVLEIGSAVSRRASTTAPTPPGLLTLTPARGMGLALLAGAAILAILGVRLFRQGLALGTVLLLLLPTALVVGGYLLFNASLSTATYDRSTELANPVPASAASVERGGALFAQNCVVCHGSQGRGDGPEVATLNPRPPDMTQPHSASHTDGYLFNIITRGSSGSAMPAWNGRLSESERWDLVNYVRTFSGRRGP